MKHTKGKWAVRHSESKYSWKIIGTVPGGLFNIARCDYIRIDNNPELTQRGKDEAEANAKLISKSPEVLEALKDLQERVIRCRTILEDGHGGNWNILDTKKSEELLKELES